MRFQVPACVNRFLAIGTLMFVLVCLVLPIGGEEARSPTGSTLLEERMWRFSDKNEEVCIPPLPPLGTIAPVERLSAESVRVGGAWRLWLVSLVVLTPIVTVGLGVGARPALAATPWSALWVSQCCATDGGSIVELEVGEVRWSAFVARNVGLYTWYPAGGAPVRLGTAEPRDRSSSMLYSGPGEGAWIGFNRPAGLPLASVGPGETVVFRFRVLAPNDPGDHKEYFEPVADGPSGSWLGTTIGAGCTPDRWCGANLIYRIRAKEPPRASLADLPDSIAAGSPLRLVTQANDNTGLDRVVASVDGNVADAQVDQLPRPDSHIADPASFGLIERLIKSRRSTFAFSPPSSCRWSPGDHTVKVQAYDNVNQVDQATRTFTVLSDGDCDGVADKADDCPTIAAPPSRRNGCPQPSAKAAKASVLFAAAGTGSDRGRNKIKLAAVRGVVAGARVEAFCRPACGRVLRFHNLHDNATVKFPGLVDEIVPDGTRIVFKAMMPRRRNVFGRQWTWRLENGPRGPRRQCLAPGLAGHVGCD